MEEKLIPFDNGLVRGYYLDNGKKPTIEECKKQMWEYYEFMEKYDLWDYFDDVSAFERHLIRKWGNLE